MEDIHVDKEDPFPGHLIHVKTCNSALNLLSLGGLQQDGGYS